MGASTSHVVPQLYGGELSQKECMILNLTPPPVIYGGGHLRSKKGRQTWTYLTDEALKNGAKHQNGLVSRYHVGLPIDPVSLANTPCPCPTCMKMKEEYKGMEGPKEKSAKTVEDHIKSAVRFFGKVQTDDGHWAGDYGGPMFLLPGFAIVYSIAGFDLSPETQSEIVRYLSNMQNKDGGFGIHIESSSTVFGTVLNYVTMRIFGLPYEDERAKVAREWIKTHGGCIGIPQWGKFWLAVLGVYSWDGLNSLLPEMCLMPTWVPLHPHNMWCYCRTVYCSMSYLYGLRYQGPITELVKEFRRDLFFDENGNNIEWGDVNWGEAKWNVSESDLYTPHTKLLNLSFSVFNIYEKWLPKWFIRSWSLDYIYDVAVTKEDEFTNYIDIGPVNKVINLLCVFVKEGTQSDAYKKHVARIPDYLWMGHDGMKMNGTNGSQLWDTSFLVQGMMELMVGSDKWRQEFSEIFNRANNFVDLTQIRVNHPEHAKYWRDETKGGWPFSTRDIGWVVADCTGEGLKAAILCKMHDVTATPLSIDRIQDAVDLLIKMQNNTGGYATCEKTRGGTFFEYFNASEVFGEIMIDYDYVECTSSSLQALAVFTQYDSKYRANEVKNTIDRARDFILSIQREDGSWEGMWGICFTYGTWFAIDGLISAGVSSDHPAVLRACDFLISKQKEDGGWGETFMSCVERKYVQNPISQVNNTAWALLALLKSKNQKYYSAICKGIQFLLDRQLANGDWPQENICGVFNKNCMIDYTNFKNIFPIWALCRFSSMYPDAL